MSDALVPPREVFRAYDIRGVADTQLTDPFMELLGRALGTEARLTGTVEVLLGRDARTSSPRIHAAVKKGLMATGVHVRDLGIVPTPAVHFAAHYRGIANAVMVTGSHNPAEYNGIKMLFDRQSLSKEQILGLRERILRRDWRFGKGSEVKDDISEPYFKLICGDIQLKKQFKVVVDAANGATSAYGPELLERLGCKVEQLHCRFDGRFPNHPPDPTVDANLQDLRSAVAQNQADFGIAFDGDGDRVVFMTASGRALATDELLALLAEDVLERNPGATILYDVKSSRNLERRIEALGGKPLMWKTGHSHMKHRLATSGALVGAELSGHVFFKERWYGFDDGLYAAGRVLEVLDRKSIDLEDWLDQQQALVSTPEILLAVSEEKKFEIMDSILEIANFDSARVSYIDGLRVDFVNGWGLVRASNTGPSLTLRFEADNERALEEIKQQFRELLALAAPKLDVGF